MESLLVQCESQGAGGSCSLPPFTLSKAQEQSKNVLHARKIQPVPWPQDGRDFIDAEQKFPYLRELKQPISHSAGGEGERPHPDQALSTCSVPQVKWKKLGSRDSGNRDLSIPPVTLLPSLPRALTLSGAYLEIPGILHSTDTMAVPRHLYAPDRHFLSH